MVSVRVKAVEGKLVQAGERWTSKNLTIPTLDIFTLLVRCAAVSSIFYDKLHSDHERKLKRCVA